MEIIEKFIYYYYSYKTEIFISIFLLFFIITISGLINFKVKKENLRYIINKLIYKGIYSAIIVVIGELLCLMGLDIKIEYVHFNAAVFIMIIGGIVIYGILLCLMFKKILLPMQQICKYIQYITCLELFLLAITQHLEIWEWITGTLGIISIELLIMLFEKQLDSIQKEKEKETDHPDPNLYLTRKIQLEKFVTILKQQEQEPYAIMVSGEWGTGKSSFIQALAKTLYKSSFIWIYAGSEKTVPEIMSEISAKIVRILKKNNILIENKDVIEKYFLAFSDLIEDTALKPLKNLSSILMRSKGISDKDYLNKKLDELKYPIYLIIDDLDRCDNEYQEKMFKVIRESMCLQNCKTIFLVDKNKFLKEKCDTNYIEKYVSFTLDLCEVGYTEIVSYLIDDIWKNNFIQDMNSILLQGRNVEQIKEIICNCPIKIIERLEVEILKENDALQKEKENNFLQNNGNHNGIQERINVLQREETKVKKYIRNSRKVKNYLKGIKRDAIILNNMIKENAQTFQSEDWLMAIIEVQFVKNFMPEYYYNIKMGRNITMYDNITNIVFNLYNNTLIYNEKKSIVLNYIIYEMYVTDFSKVRTLKNKFYTELYSNKRNIANLEEYLKIIESYDDLDNILFLYESHQFNDDILQVTFINKILNLLSDQFNSFKVHTKESLDFSRRFINCLIKKGLTNEIKQTCISEGKLIIHKALLNNAKLFINILSILFDIRIVEKNWYILVGADINDLYEIHMKIDENSLTKGLENNKDKLSSLKTYYKDLEIELMKEKYMVLGLDIKKMFSDINIIFDICEFWDNIEYMLNDSEKEETTLSFKEYFILESEYTFREKVFDDVTHLVKALKELNNFYKSKENDYKSQYSLLLLRLSYSVIVQYRTKPAWFGEDKKKIAKLMLEAADLTCRLDKPIDDYDNDVITKIKIYTYKFNEYCSDAE